MTLPKGMRLGPYEIVSALGAGGMGEVYRARDARLGRDVAIKVLPSEFSADPARLERFEREARAASALSDPHIVAVYDIGTENGVSYIVTELIEGSDLRAVLERGAPSLRRTLDLAVQIADGLAAAHEKGIVHRDLKPENVLVTENGLAKIADFGLAKLTDPESGASQLPTAAGQSTQTGTIMGTVGYMSPEQASGLPVDFRSDQFSLGAILYELATGRRAFHRGAPVLTLAAILQEEPEPAGTVNPAIPAPFRWVIDRCLSKEPQGRYSATRDLARELQSIRDHISEASLSVAPGELVAPRRRRAVTAAVIAALALATAVFLLLWLLRPRAAAPRFSDLTFREGLIASARFTPDGQSIIYGASWEGRPVELYTIRPPAVESRRLDLPPASILAISSNGEMALSEGCRFRLNGEHACLGTLAEVPIDGRTPRELLEHVRQADWSPDGKTMVIVRDDKKGARTLEYPPGKVLYRSTKWIGQPRISPDGKRIAFWEKPADSRTGTVSVIDLQGHKRDLVAGWEHCPGLAWSPGGEIWFTPLREREYTGLYAVSVSGRQRLVYRSPVALRLHDISANGALLVTVDRIRGALNVVAPPDFRDRDFSWLSMSLALDLSKDGKTLLFEEAGPQAPGTYLRRTDGPSDAVPLGSGPVFSLSGDGKWIVTYKSEPAPHLSLVPIGPGGEKDLPRGRIDNFENATFFPDGSTILIEGNERGRPNRCYSQRIDGGDEKPLTPEGTEACLVSPDGKTILAADGDGQYAEYPAGGGAARSISGIEKGESPIQWGGDSRSLFLRSGMLPVKLIRLDLATGGKTPVRDVSPADPAGILDIRNLLVTPSGQSYAYSYVRMLSNLCLVEGLR